MRSNFGFYELGLLSENVGLPDVTSRSRRACLMLHRGVAARRPKADLPALFRTRNQRTSKNGAFSFRTGKWPKSHAQRRKDNDNDGALNARSTTAIK